MLKLLQQGSELLYTFLCAMLDLKRWMLIYTVSEQVYLYIEVYHEQLYHVIYMEVIYYFLWNCPNIPLAVFFFFYYKCVNWSVGLQEVQFGCDGLNSKKSESLRKCYKLIC